MTATTIIIITIIIILIIIIIIINDDHLQSTCVRILSGKVYQKKKFILEMSQTQISEMHINLNVRRMEEM